LQALLKEVDQVRHAPQDDKLLQRVSALSSQDSGQWTAGLTSNNQQDACRILLQAP
jgi:hypothetical protein